MESAITIKGQATIPKAIREYLRLKPGDRIKFFMHPNGSVVILPRLPAAAAAAKGILKSRRGRSVTIDEMAEGAAQGAVSRMPKRGR